MHFSLIVVSLKLLTTFFIILISPHNINNFLINLLLSCHDISLHQLLKLCNECAKTGSYVDMVKAGIIDPLKVVRTALVDAAR